MKVFTSPQQQNQNITALISVHLKSAKVTLLLHEMAQRLCGRVIREPGSKYRDQFQLPFLPLSKVVQLSSRVCKKATGLPPLRWDTFSHLLGALG